MRSWIEPLCQACQQWTERTELPITLIVGPLLIYSGGNRDEFLDRSAESLARWFHQLVDETGIDDHFLIFASIKLTEAGFVDWLNRLDKEHSGAQIRFPNSTFAKPDIELDRKRRQSALDVWREVSSPILKGSIFGALD